MQTWRRTLATSAARLGYNNAPSARTPGPAALRCAQILQDSGRNGHSSLEEQEIKVNGFIRSVRKQKRFAFAEVSDGSTVEALQAFLSPSQAAEYVTTSACSWAIAHLFGLWHTVYYSVADS